jgi:AhpD family alkylhydroperoxidase
VARISYPDLASLPPDIIGLLSQIPRHGPVEMLSHTPALAKLFLLQGQALITSIELSARQRELVILTVGVLTGCDYEIIQHVPISEAAGVDAAQRDALSRRDFHNSALSPEDRTLVCFVQGVIDAPRVSDALFRALRRRLSDRQIVEVIQIVGAYWAFARLCTTLDIEVQAATDLTSVQALERLRP